MYSKFPKLLVLLLVMLLASFVNCHGQEDSLFATANRFYQNNEFDKAIETYTRLIEAGNRNPDVLFNLGNAYFKAKNLSYAILYYEKAKLYAPFDDDINQNLAIANARIVDRIDIIPDLFLRRWIYNFVNQFQSNTWAVLSIIIFATALTLLLFYFFSGTIQIKKMSFYLSVLLLIMSFISFWCSVKRLKYITENHSAIVVDPSVTIKSSPDAEGNNVFVLHEGTKVTVVDSMENWKEIRLTDGNKGWLESISIQPI
jgi:tetratricopeptide (TPR) repeat protein